LNKSFLNFLDSQKLSRLSIISNSGFHYNKKSKGLHWSKDLFLGMNNFEKIYLSAYTDADMNEILPDKIFLNRKNINGNKYDLKIYKTRNAKWVCEYENQISSAPSLVQFQENTEVEAKAKMVMFLLKKKLLEL
jgi:hypothetical protein